jgi:hypothetical protein
VVVAVVVVWWNRDTMFTRDGAVTEVIPAKPVTSRKMAE